jgi:hypothetical protein
MNTSSFSRWLAGGPLILALWGVGPSSDPVARADKPSDKDTKTEEIKRTPLGKNKNLFLEVQGEKRRVLIEAAVCLREGQLEELLCRKGTKEHEALLAADVDARTVHLALIAAGAEAGAPVKFQPKYQAARGTSIKISLQYEQKGQKVIVSAKDWIRNPKTKKNLEPDWVFAGSQLMPNPDGKDKPPIYLANYGDLICVCNMESAMLDLPVPSPKSFENRLYEAHTERIPPLETKVTIILEPVAEKKDK